mmetsp:Transcript_107588/g.304148  ORF Transcript_107588/g.304148 Transcript_107588/m.304148 type:complete len:377 (+) Transcript_107588:42-1172(+)
MARSSDFDSSPNKRTMHQNRASPSGDFTLTAFCIDHCSMSCPWHAVHGPAGSDVRGIHQSCEAHLLRDLLVDLPPSHVADARQPGEEGACPPPRRQQQGEGPERHAGHRGQRRAPPHRGLARPAQGHGPRVLPHDDRGVHGGPRLRAAPRRRARAALRALLLGRATGLGLREALDARPAGVPRVARGGAAEVLLRRQGGLRRVDLPDDALLERLGRAGKGLVQLRVLEDLDQEVDGLLPLGVRHRVESAQLRAEHVGHLLAPRDLREVLDVGIHLHLRLILQAPPERDRQLARQALALGPHDGVEALEVVPGVRVQQVHRELAGALAVPGAHAEHLAQRPLAECLGVWVLADPGQHVEDCLLVDEYRGDRRRPIAF